MRKLLFMTCLLAVSCNQSTQQETPNQNTTAQKSIDLDSIQTIYNQLIEDFTPKFPNQQTFEKGKLYPVDQSILDPTFFVFLNDLRKAVQQKSLFGLLDKVDKNIQTNANEVSGFAQFIEMWNLEDEQKALQSKIWSKMEFVLDNGGVFNSGKTVYTAPYYYATFPSDTNFENGAAITGEGVRMRSQPTLNSSIVEVLSYDLVEIIDESGPSQTIGGATFPWVKVRFQKKEGYIFGKFIGKKKDYSLKYKKRPNGDWKIVAFIANG